MGEAEGVGGEGKGRGSSDGRRGSELRNETKSVYVEVTVKSSKLFYEKRNLLYVLHIYICITRNTYTIVCPYGNDCAM